MCDAEVLRAASNIPRRLLESEGLRNELASRLHTSLPPAALRSIQQRFAVQHTKQQPKHSQPTRDADPPKAAAPPATPVPGLELPLLGLDSGSDVPDAVCQPGMQPVTPRGLCKPLGSHASEQNDSFSKVAAGPARAGANSTAAASRLPLAFSLQLALLPLLLAGFAAVIGPPVKGTLLGSSSLAGARSWGIACSCSSTLLLLCTHTAYARLGWRVGALNDLLWLALRGARSHSLLLFAQGAVALLACRLMLAGCAMAAGRQRAAAAKSPIAHTPDLHMHQWRKA
ncbi:hypothetical protein COHA_002809 [Chlorella ohadii]|uniref:Uncharacterized protein n=1 Tax=Chlorella ohadii TaxID=2649997 RepID=A0AAD5DTV7_9CHLO|nr:hypothetical protein COHA_002809 [Chlorella ohadii]